MKNKLFIYVCVLSISCFGFTRCSAQVPNTINAKIEKCKVSWKNVERHPKGEDQDLILSSVPEALVTIYKKKPPCLGENDQFKIAMDDVKKLLTETTTLEQLGEIKKKLEIFNCGTGCTSLHNFKVAITTLHSRLLAGQSNQPSVNPITTPEQQIAESNQRINQLEKELKEAKKETEDSTTQIKKLKTALEGARVLYLLIGGIMFILGCLVILWLNKRFNANNVGNNQPIEVPVEKDKPQESWFSRLFSKWNAANPTGGSDGTVINVLKKQIGELQAKNAALEKTILHNGNSTTEIASLNGQIAYLNNRINQLTNQLDVSTDPNNGQTPKLNQQGNSGGVTYFFKLPDGDMRFYDASKVTKEEPNETYYYVFQTNPKNPNRATFKFISNSKTVYSAIYQEARCITPVCELINVSSEDTKSIETSVNGIAELVDGIWQVRTRAKIRYL